MVITVFLLQYRVKDTYFLRISTAVKMLKYCMDFFYSVKRFACLIRLRNSYYKVKRAGAKI